MLLKNSIQTTNHSVISLVSVQIFRCKDNEILTRARTAKAFLEIPAFDAEHLK